MNIISGIMIMEIVDEVQNKTHTQNKKENIAYIADILSYR